jgi:antirestriction protein
VTVKCVRCEGEGKVTHHNSETGDTRLCECPECIGSGRVASAEEYAVHDYDDMPSTFGEYPGLQAIADYVEFLEEHDSHDSEDLEAIIKDFGNLKDASDAMENQFICISESFREYADNAADEQMSCHSSDGKIPQFLIDYFDYEAYARDIKHDYNVIDVPSGVAIFSH